MKNSWRALATVLLLLGTSLAAVVVLIFFTERAYLEPGDTVQILTLAVLVAVTFWYAISTHRINSSTDEQATAIREQADTSRRALEVALDAEKNAVIPIVKLSIGSTSTGAVGVEQVGATCTNIGRGPALNLRMWLESRPLHATGIRKSSIKPYRALGVNESWDSRWTHRGENEPLPSLEKGFYIVAEYSDIFGRGFVSKLFYSHYEPTEQGFSFSPLPE